MNRRIWMVLSMLALAGCIAERSGSAPEIFPFREGETVLREVVEKWGNPDRVREDELVWMESRSLGSKFRLAYRGIGFTAANSNGAIREWVLKFDEEGVLRSRELGESLPGGIRWSPCPFKN